MRLLLAFLPMLMVLSCSVERAAVTTDNGRLVLPNEVLTGVHAIRGVWEVYAGEDLTPEDLRSPDRRRYTIVPPRHGRYYDVYGDRLLSGDITFRLEIENIPRTPPVAVKIPAIHGKVRGWVNGQLVVDTGGAGRLEAPGTVQSGLVVPLHPDPSGTTELVLRLQTSHLPFGGMVHYPPSIGPLHEIVRGKMVGVLRDGILIGALLILGTYHFLLSLGPHRSVPTVTLGALLYVLGVHIFLAGGESTFGLLPQLSADTYTRLLGIAWYPIMPLFMRFLRELFPTETNARVFRFIERLYWVWLLASVVAPPRWWMDILYAATPLTVVAVGFSGAAIVRSLRSRRDGSILVGIGVASIVLAIIVYLGGKDRFTEHNGTILGYGLVAFGALNSLAVFLRFVDFRISLTNLKEQAQHDGLTGLYNRRILDHRVEEEWIRHIRAARSVALLMIDVDHFKSYNDTHGHRAGDTVLQTIGTVLDAHARRNGDTAARYGGEEFVLLLPHTDIHGAYKLAERIQKAILEKAIAHPSAPGGLVTVSIGITAVVPSHDSRTSHEWDCLYRAADRALYEAKQSGRNAIRTAPCTQDDTCLDGTPIEK